MNKKGKKMNKKALFYFISVMFILILTGSVLAETKYSFENSEKLKPLINWRDYGPEAFQEALDENKPIFLLLTAPSWCYWCQVYESEDYLFHPEVYPYINEHFIPIYVDADQRQDLTRQYLEGGWPSTTVMAPNRERLFGYSGARPMLNILVNLKKTVEYVNSQIFSAQINYDYTKTEARIPAKEELNNLVNSYAEIILQSYDSEYGGFGRNRFETIQKFPQARTLDFALELYEQTKNKQWLELVENTLQNQYTKIDEIETNYNLFDPVEGGFHRYGAESDWTPPHYEKMLYDNAKLLKTYFHLLQITPDDELVKEVVDKTNSYIKDYWYDKENGGFYGNTDVHGEEEYYGKFPRPAEKPRVEKTKYTDWNSEAILTYLYLWKITKNKEYREISEKSLDFFAKEMITDYGAYHYKKPDGEKGVRGSLLDNSYLLLAFVEAYEITGKQEYLEVSKKLADYSLENLYDWNSGGFFERNSPDKELYAPGDHILLSKPAEENGIISYALLKLYKQTQDILYLNAGIKTIGSGIENIIGLDRGYYYVKSAQFIIQNNLLSDFSQIKSQVEETEKEKQKSFWINELIDNNQDNKNAKFVVSEKGLNKISGSIFLLIIIALFAGFISFVSPCTLPILPAYVAYSLRSTKYNIKGMTIAFFLGLTVVFALLGMSATLIGTFLRSHITVFSQIAGIAIMLFGIYILFRKGFRGLKIKKTKPTNYIGSFVFGAALGISWTPCVGPILVAILLLASTTNSVLTGGILLFSYGVGLALPLVLVSAYIGKIDKKGRFWRIMKGKGFKFNIFNKTIRLHTSSLIPGLLFIILGYLIFSGMLFAFNQYIASTWFQSWIFKIEDWLLSLVR